MMLISVRDDLAGKLMEISSSSGKSISEYVNEVFEQAIRAHQFNCSLKETVDHYERTITEKKAAEEAERVEEPSIPEVFERMLAEKMIAEKVESEERKMLSKFLSQISGSV